MLSAKTFSVGRINYINVLPLYYPMEENMLEHPFSFVYDVPSVLNRKAYNSDLELTPVSLFSYLYDFKRYHLVDDLSISSSHAVKSVLLFSEKPIEDLHNEPLQLTNESETSVALLKILLAELYSITPLYQDLYKNNTSKATAKLLIGDSALKEATNNNYPYVYDLASLWYQHTKKPFVFAVWVIPKQHINSALLQSVDLFYLARDWSLNNMSQIYTKAKEITKITDKDIIDYYNLLHYSLGNTEKESLLEYAFLLHKHNLIPQKVPSALAFA